MSYSLNHKARLHHRVHLSLFLAFLPLPSIYLSLPANFLVVELFRGAFIQQSNGQSEVVRAARTGESIDLISTSNARPEVIYTAQNEAPPSLFLSLF